MTRADELTLLRAVASERDGAWLCHMRREIPGALSIRILAGLHNLKLTGLVSQSSGAYDMSTWRLTAAGKARLWPPRRERRPMARAA